ncbi:MAG TPA: alpha/beta hydrolase [Micromonosporaceae bacterium]
MPTAMIDGIATRFDVTGTGPALLMYSPGGFDARLENWSDLGIYRSTGVLSALADAYTCIRFDRRESGLSGGRVERLTWSSYATQGLGLLDHLGIERAFLMGGCVGCSSVLALAVAHPDRVRGMVLYWPAGGPRYRMAQHARFAQHAAYVREHGTAAVVDLVCSHDRSFTQDPRVGPWVSVIRRDPAFAAAYAQRDPAGYGLMLTAMARTLFDRDTVPGVEPEDLMLLDVPALVVPGEDTSHAPSAARYLQECLPRADFWDMPVAGQDAETAPQRVLTFLAGQR